MSELFKHAHLHAGLTENGAVNHTSSMSALVDFYKAAGSSRSNVEILPDLFYKALREDVMLQFVFCFTCEMYEKVWVSVKPSELFYFKQSKTKF